MSDDKKPGTREYELQTGTMLNRGRTCTPGDKVELDPEHAKDLAERFGTVGPVGTLEKRRQAEAKVVQAQQEAQQAMQAAADAHLEETGEPTHVAVPGPTAPMVPGNPGRTGTRTTK